MRYFKLKTSCWLERGDVLEVAERLTASSRCHRLRCNSLIESTVVADAYHSSSLEKRVSVCNREVSGRGFMLYYHAKSSTHYPRLYSRVYLQDILPNKSSEKNELRCAEAPLNKKKAWVKQLDEGMQCNNGIMNTTILAVSFLIFQPVQHIVTL